MQPKGCRIAATNRDRSRDSAIGRRFDEVLWFDKPEAAMIARFLKLKFKNVPVAFDPARHSAALEGHSFAEIERVCTQAIKAMIIERRKQVQERDFNRALQDEARRRAGQARLAPMI